MFVSKKRYDAEWRRRIHAETELEMSKVMLKQMTIALERMNKRLHGFSEDELSFLIKRCHPDLNGGKEVATGVTRKLLEMRRK